MKKFVSILLLLTNLNVSNANSIEADVFVQSTVNRASEILSKNISKEEKINGLKIIAKETVDIRGIGFYSLGSTRKVLNDSQKQKYFDLFENYFLKSFSSRLSEYTNPKIEVQDKKEINRNYTIVNSILGWFYRQTRGKNRLESLHKKS
jgi:phospholipid transport system substrate-binding protein